MNIYIPLKSKDWYDLGMDTLPLNVGERAGDEKTEDGITTVPFKMERNPDAGFWNQKFISFEKFKTTDIALFVCSWYMNEKAFYELLKLKPNAKYIRMVQNMGEYPRYTKHTLMVPLTPLAEQYNRINWWPEHYDGYKYTEPKIHNNIESFINMNVELDFWNRLKKALPGNEFHLRGENDKHIFHSDMPEAMRKIAFNWGAKPHGGGGFLLRQALACGRPCLVKTSYCRRGHASEESLLEHGVNCIDFDKASFSDCVEMIKQWSEPIEHIRRCEIVANKFQHDVDFDKDAKKVGKWIDDIKENSVPIVESRNIHEEKVIQWFREEARRLPLPHELERCVNQMMVDDREEVIRAHIKSLGREYP
jgi:hypothetical protein